MDRRGFLKVGGAGLAGLAVGASAGEVGGRLLEESRGTRRRERATFAGMGDGSVRVVWSIETVDPAVALTFDDGPHPVLTPRVLDELARHEVHATFFFLGSAAERYPDLVKRTVDEGHEIGNHSYSHKRMAYLDGVDAREEVLRGSEVLADLIGYPPSWFRPPRGMLSGPILRAAADLDQDVAMWSARAPYASAEATAPEVTEYLLDGLDPGAIFILHDGTSGRDDDARLGNRRQRELAGLPAFLAGAREQGFTCTTLSELDEGPPDA